MLVLTENRFESEMTMFAVLLLSLFASLITAQEKSSNLYCNTEDDQLFVYRVPNHSCSCSAKSEGTLRYYNKKLQICDGEKYVDVGSGGSKVIPTEKPTPAPTPSPEIGSEKNPGSSCNHIASSLRNAKSGMYYLRQGGVTIKAYCFMGEMCGSRGWTMVMKIDGAKSTFNFNSKYWTNKQPYNVVGAGKGLDNTEVKLDSYSHTPLSKLCLGMKTAGKTRWMKLEYRASSLYALIADGKYRETHNGRGAWKSLIGGSSLQRYCNREGFNVNVKDVRARIGIVNNQENNCNTPDSRLGFGTSGTRCGQHANNAAGNEARCSADNGDKSIRGFGYIFVQEPLDDAPLGSFDKPASSCKAIKAARSGAGNGVYYLNLKDKITRVYCHMDTICGSKGWTLLLKMDGNKQSFKHDSVYWTSHHVFNVEAVSQGLNSNSEMKLHTYSSFSFSKLCLGMRVGASTRWLSVSHRASSLYSVISTNKYLATRVGRNAWKSLVSGSSLQRHCNREGFNINLSIKARIGIVSNQENNCASCDSYIGLGVKPHGACGLKNTITAGNGAGCSPDNGNRNTAAMGFILAQ